MKYFYAYIIAVFFSISGIFAQSFRVLSFEEDASDLSAVKNSRTDVNDQKCAIIKVYTNLDALYFESRLGIEGDIVTKTGEFWVYVSPREKMLKIIKSGYIPLEFAIPTNIEESKVYKLTLTSGSKSINLENSKLKNEFVVFETNPSNAEIYINDQLRGLSPLTIPLLEGNYICRIEKTLHKTDEFDIIVKTDNTINITRTLEELDIYGKININCDDFADIYIDNQKIATGFYSGRIIQGVHIVEVRSENYKTFTREILIVANRDYNIDTYLEAKLGTISVQSSPLGASIFIDGEYVGSTPKFVRDIKVGQRKITLEKEGYASSSKVVNVIYDKTAEYDFVLVLGRQLTIKTEPETADVYLNNVIIGQSPVVFYLDYSKYNKIKINKDGYHTVFDEIPQGSLLKEKTYKLEKLQKGIVVNKQIKTLQKPKNTNYLDKRSIIGWSLSGLSGRPGGINSSLYVNFGKSSQYGIFAEAGFQYNNYDNNYLSGIVRFPRFDFGLQYNLWLKSFAVFEFYGAMGREYATGLPWKNASVWEAPTDVVYTQFIKFGARLGVRISPHTEIFGAFNLNYTDGPAFDIWNNQTVVSGVSYNYETLFRDRSNPNWELGLRFVLY